MSNDFYVYIHRKATTGEPFYVGKGKDNRAWSKKSRSPFWHSTVKKNGICVEIVQSGMQEWWAFELEVELIARYGRRDMNCGTLTNLSSGGDGPSGRIVTLEQRAAQSKVADKLWSNKDFREKQYSRLVAQGHEQGVKVRCVELDLLFDNQCAAAEYMQKIGINLKPNYLSQYFSSAKRSKCAGFTWEKIGSSFVPVEKKHYVTAVVGFDTIFMSQRSALKWLYETGVRNSLSLNSGVLNGAVKGKKPSAYGSEWRYATPEETAALKEKGASWAPLSSLSD